MAKLTKKTLLSTFESMLDEMPFDRITVRELAKRSDISTNGFYANFMNIYDLLEKWYLSRLNDWKEKNGESMDGEQHAFGVHDTVICPCA